MAELTPAGFEQILLDLRHVEFIDSTGLQMLLGVRDDARRSGYTLTLVSPKPEVRRIFTLTAPADSSTSGRASS